MILIAAFAAILGLAIGSFLNVVVYRVPLGLSIVSPPSSCPNCATPIRARDNIPVLSWLLLGAKCRTCREPISARYPLVELTTGILFFVVALVFATPIIEATDVAIAVSATLVLVAFLYLTAISVALTLIDLDVHRLPNTIVLPSYLVAGALFLAASVVSGDYLPLLRAVIGMAALAAAYFLMAFAYPGGMGLGDVKLAGVLGIFLGWLGWGPLVVGAFAAFLLGGVFSVGLLIARKATRKSGIPFGPWMLLGAGVGTFFGEVIAGGYLALVGLV